MSEELVDSVEANNAMASSATSDSAKVANRSKWQRLIDYELIEWGRNLDQLGDEGVEAPTPDTIKLAIIVATKCRDFGFPAPDHVVRDVNGGIVFRRRENDVSEVIYVWDDGTVEYQCFRGTHMTDRKLLST